MRYSIPHRNQKSLCMWGKRKVTRSCYAKMRAKEFARKICPMFLSLFIVVMVPEAARVEEPAWAYPYAVRSANVSAASFSWIIVKTAAPWRGSFFRWRHIPQPLRDLHLSLRLLLQTTL